jgi:uncharacterized membrane protein
MARHDVFIDHLQQVSLFAACSRKDLQLVAKRAEEVRVPAGKALVTEGETGHEFFVILEGKAQVNKGGVDVNVVGPGDFFGELAVLDSGERSANASAVVDSTLHRLSREDFHGFLLKYPHAGIDVIREVAARLRATNLLVSQRVTRNINAEMDEKMTMGQRVADKVASFGGSWTFIFIYCTFLLAWMLVNTFVLAKLGKGEDGAQFDPYPYILLNLMLSMTAALQAPIIMMSQNRAGEKDRLAAEQDFKVNLKSELMLEELVRRDRERTRQIDELLSQIGNLQGGGAAAKSDGQSSSEGAILDSSGA